MSDSEAGKGTVGAVLRDVAIGGVAGSAAAGLGGELTAPLMESALTEWYNTNVHSSLVLKGDRYKKYRQKDGTNVHTSLYDCLQKAYKFQQSQVTGIVYVLCVEPYLGKTHCAAHLLDCVASKKPLNRGLMVSGSKNRTISYDLAVASSIFVPERCRTKFDWIEKLLEALAGDLEETISGAAAKQAQNCLGLASELLCATDPLRDEGYVDNPPQNKVGEYPPILVLDDFDTATPEEQKFVKHIGQVTQRSRVLVFILTDKKEVAQTLCGVNGLQRVQPLYNSYHPPPGRKLIQGDAISWKTFSWTKKQLTELVVLKQILDGVPNLPYNDQSCLEFLEEGMTPLEALRAAGQFLASHVPANTSDA